MKNRIVICDYCGTPADFVNSSVVYHGHSFGMIYLCPRLTAGCQKMGTRLNLRILECSMWTSAAKVVRLIGINACAELMPGVPMVAVFDTAFHQTMPEKAYLYGLPYEYYEKYAVRRYGFHGTSHSFVSKHAAEPSLVWI